MAEFGGSGGAGEPDRPRSQRRTSAAGRIPPYDENAEVGLLGAAMQRAEQMLDLCVQARLSSDAFYVPAHRALFEAMVDLNNAGRGVDLITLGEYLERKGRLDFVGGHEFLERLQDNTPTAAHGEYYLDIVHEKFLLRAMIDRARQVIDHCYEEDENAAELLQRAEQSFFEIAEYRNTETTSWNELIKHTMEEIELILQTKRGLTGLPTGFRDLDNLLLGLQAGDMIILAARPSMGKTSLAMNIVEHVATGYRSCAGYRDQAARSVAVFSLEMSADQLVRRMLCCSARVSSHRLSRGILPRESHGALTNAADVLIKAPILVDDSAGLSALEVKSRARRMKARHNIGLIVVDYLQLMNYPMYAKDRQREIAAISGVMKAMAKELKLPVIVLSQFSRAPEGRHGSVPKLSDLRDSGAIEQDADVVLLLRRPIRAPDDPEHNAEDPKLSIVDVAKHRNGPTGPVRLNFEEDYTRFMDRADRVMPEEGAFDVGEASAL